MPASAVPVNMSSINFERLVADIFNDSLGPTRAELAADKTVILRNDEGVDLEFLSDNKRYVHCL